MGSLRSDASNAALGRPLIPRDKFQVLVNKGRVEKVCRFRYQQKTNQQHVQEKEKWNLEVEFEN
jgi:hypothetical protein